MVPSLHQDIWFDAQGKPAIVLNQLAMGSPFQGGMAYVVLGKVGFRLPPDYPGQPNPHDVRSNYIDRQGRLLVVPSIAESLEE